MERQRLKDKFIGALVGTFVGDTLGMAVEGYSLNQIEAEYGHIEHMLEARLGSGTYTDDTEMMIGVAESLIAVNGFDGKDMANKFITNLNLDRGYGSGTIQALNNIKAGTSWQEAGKYVFGNGSFGNGSAMRVAPIGVFYHDNYEKLKEKAKKSSLITHAHPLGKTGATLQALTVGYAINQASDSDFSVENYLNFLSKLLDLDSKEFSHKFRLINEYLDDQPNKEQVAKELGSDTRVFNSVPTSIYSFLANLNEFRDAVLYAINLGGDTDTVGAMTGAIAGAYHGFDKIPKDWLNNLENNKKGLDYIINLGERLFELRYNC
ncbi:ADP-ribosylglycohydrolase family protein [Selenihalanaerobacter shriftii]|uniref:Poly(ADP-ribose) glycohydrolase ARH3 n=1 Tax=Selenihalanaerobacter shriftii TaxID=142842 RepID=A0A1T4PBR8_9FIRM|nr:ADP-ribosylglycohydrolase family protein [Selenihalanaerobacter shriftii]SJZ88278.1 poly(ADP-ribose) glycohydrolase ARH3 [Selenihalanaerobacter shriftii]